MGQARQISAADAVKAFKSAGISVRTGRATKVKGEDGKTRDSYEVKNVPLAEAHVLAASEIDGRVVMTTIDGAKYDTKAAPAKADA